MLTAYGLQQMANALDGLVASGNYTIGGTTYTGTLKDIAVSGDTIRKAMYLTDKDAFGTVTQAQLLDASGNVIAQRTDQLSHVQGTGLWIEFKWTVSEV